MSWIKVYLTESYSRTGSDPKTITARRTPVEPDSSRNGRDRNGIFPVRQMRGCCRRCVRGIRTFGGVADWRLRASFQLEDLFHSVFREVASGRSDLSAVNPSAISEQPHRRYLQGLGVNTGRPRLARGGHWPKHRGSVSAKRQNDRITKIALCDVPRPRPTSLRQAIQPRFRLLQG
jgi:hypothetical protein